MFKKVGVSLVALIFTTTLLSSCSKTHEACDAYTLQDKMKKINTIKETAILNTPIVNN